MRPMPALPMICSPHVFLSSEALRLMPSMGFTPSTTSTGMTRNVMMFQAMPAERGHDRPGKAAALAQRLQDEADGGGDRRPAEDRADVAPGAAQAVAQGRVAALEPDHGGADEGRVEEDDHQVLDQVEQDDEHPHAHRDGPVVADEGLPVAGEDAGDDERGSDDHHGDPRDDGEDDELLVLPQHAPAQLDELPAPSEAPHDVVLLCSSPRPRRRAPARRSVRHPWYRPCTAASEARMRSLRLRAGRAW